MTIILKIAYDRERFSQGLAFGLSLHGGMLQRVLLSCFSAIL